MDRYNTATACGKGKAVQFNVGPFTYIVHRQWCLTLDGEPIDGYCASTIRCIFLDADLDDVALESTLMHEHEHAWEFELAPPRTPEDRANFHTTVSLSFREQFDEQGGLDALKIVPVEGLPPQKGKVQKGDPRFSDRVYCGGCGAAIMSGSIYSSEPRHLLQAGLSVLDRGCKCPACDKVQVWTERATPDGLPTGEFLRARLLDGSEAVQWIDEHRGLCTPFNDF